MDLLQEYASAELQISIEELRDFEAKGVIKALVENGRVFYSSRDLYRLRGILKMMRTNRLSFEEAHQRVTAPITQGIVAEGSK